MLKADVARAAFQGLVVETMVSVEITLPIKSVYHEGREVDLELNQESFLKGKASYKVTFTIPRDDYIRLGQPGRGDPLRVIVSKPPAKRKPAAKEARARGSR